MDKTLDAVRSYLKDGWAVIPIPSLEKGPRIANWQDTRFVLEDFTEGQNIGIALGDPSNGLVDVDLDCIEAIKIAPKVLPQTGRIHGRPSKPSSHYWYRAPGSKTEQFKDLDGSIILEIRSTKGQTVVPPSLHPSGEELSWEMQREPPNIDTAGLRAIVAQLATAVILSRHWPSTGGRHEAAGLTAGLLYVLRIEPRDIQEIIEHAATLAHDDGISDRVKYAKDTVQKAIAGTAVRGGPELGQLIGVDVVKRIRSWFGAANSGSAYDELNEKHAIIFQQSGNMVVLTEETEDNRPQLRFSKPEVMQLLYPRPIQAGTNARGNPVMKPLGAAWLVSPKRRFYKGIELAPAGQGNEGYYNMWRGFAVEPKKGRWPLFREHIDLVVKDDPEHAKYVLAWMAETVQHPGRPIGISLAFRGGQGTGKSTLAKWFGGLFGPHFLHLDSEQRLLGHFNAHLHNAIVVFADEAVWAGGKQGLGALKRMITEDTLAIERKGIDTIVVKNMIHMLVASNESWFVPVGLDNRRFAVFSVSKRRQNDRIFFEAVRKELFQGGGLPALLYDLLEWRTDVNLRVIPETHALAEQKHRSMTPAEEWWYETLIDGDLWSVTNLNTQSGEYRIDRDMLYESYIAALSKSNRYTVNGTKIQLSQFLARVLPPRYPGTYQHSSTGKRFWLLPRLGEAREHFANEYPGVSWPTTNPFDGPVPELPM